ncbi:MAG: hypothetical protein ABTR92_19620 [Candidatus Accumulibacter phosphatis]
MAIATLSIDLVARLANIERDLGRVGSLAERSARQMESAFTGASSVIGSAFAGLAGAFSVGALAEMVQSSIDAADAVSKLSQRTGESVENLSKLQYAGSLADVSNEKLADTFKKLAKNMEEAVGGSGDAADAFKAIGVAVVDSTGKMRSSGAVLNDIADEFASYKDGAEKAALAQSLFGKSGADLIPLLNAGSAGLQDMGAEAERLGVVFSTQTAQAAEQFNDNMTRLKASLSSIANQTSASLLPLLNELTSALVESAKEGESAGSSFTVLTESLRLFVLAGSGAIYTANAIGSAIAGLAAHAVALSKLDFAGFANLTEVISADEEKKRNDFTAFVQRIQNAGKTDTSAAGDSAASPGKRSAPLVNVPKQASGGGRVAKAIDDGQRLVEQLRDQVRATQELSNVEKLELAIADGKYKTASAGNLEIARGYAQILDNIKEAKDAAGEEADAWRERLAVLADGQRVFAATRTPLEALDIELEHLTELLEASAISMDTFGRAASMAGEDFIKMSDKVNETDDVLNEFAKSGASNIQSAFADFLFDPFKDGMNGMLQSFGNVIKQMIAQAVSADLTKRIFGDLSKGGLGTGWLGSLGKLFTNADGGVYSSPSLSQYSGQVVSQPTFFAFAHGAAVAGEAGPEAILPLERNASGKLGVRASGGGGHSFTFNLNGVTNEADGRRAAGQISRRVLGALAGAQRYA